MCPLQNKTRVTSSLCLVYFSWSQFSLKVNSVFPLFWTNIYIYSGSDTVSPHTGQYGRFYFLFFYNTCPSWHTPVGFVSLFRIEPTIFCFLDKRGTNYTRRAAKNVFFLLLFQIRGLLTNTLHIAEQRMLLERLMPHLYVTLKILKHRVDLFLIILFTSPFLK